MKRRRFSTLSASLFPSVAACLVASLAAAVLTSCSLAPRTSTLPDTRQLVAWNQALLATAEAEDAFLTLKGLRAAALMHLAAHDALNAIEKRHQPFALTETDVEANPTAAMIEALFTMAQAQYPDAPAWARLRQQGLAGVAPGKARTRGLALGRRAAAAVLERRGNDRWNAEASYQWHPMAPGVYAQFNEHSGTPEGFVFGAGWASAEPFALPEPEHFRVPPPPAISSDAYARAFDEVKAAGRQVSDARTADQTHLALWWKDFVENSHNRLARELVLTRGLDAGTANRLFALLNVAVFDAYVSSFENKFHYNHWRPYTAIRWASNDGNAATVEDPRWTNTHDHTYAFPSYPSAHGTACAAAMAVLKDTLGTFPFTMQTAAVDRAGPLSGKMPMDPPTRSFANFDEAALECALSRIYLGIHFRYDSIEGNRLGEQVGEFALGQLLTPVN